MAGRQCGACHHEMSKYYNHVHCAVLCTDASTMGRAHIWGFQRYQKPGSKQTGCVTGTLITELSCCSLQVMIAVDITTVVSYITDLIGLVHAFFKAFPSHFNSY